MPGSVLIFVQIAVSVPAHVLSQTAEAGGPSSVEAVPPTAGEAFIAPGVTAEMLAFYRRHPDFN
jgi:hypothetical protein